MANKRKTTSAKPRLSAFDKALATAVNEASLDAVNFHHAAGRSVHGLDRKRDQLHEFTPPTTELVVSH